MKQSILEYKLINDGNIFSWSLVAESLVVALDIYKAFHKAWHPAILNILIFSGCHPNFAPGLRTFCLTRPLLSPLMATIKIFLSFNDGVPHGFVVFLTSFFLHISFLHDLSFSTSNYFYSYADKYSFHASIQYLSRRQIIQVDPNQRYMSTSFSLISISFKLPRSSLFLCLLELLDTEICCR